MTDSHLASASQESRARGSFRTLVVIGLLLLTGMTIYEFGKQWLFPSVTIWPSHIMTILFSTAVGTTAGYFALRAYRTLHELALKELAERTRVQEERDQLIEELRGALNNVKVLSGLLPTCASCKRIRDDKGEWHQMEMYIRNHSEAEFSHGICPECAKRDYPEDYASIYPGQE